MTKRIPVSGYCDYLGCIHTIDATYAKVTFIGNPSEFAKLCKLDCCYSDECDSSDECPLEAIANEREFW